MKRKILVFALLAACLSMLAYSTTAYFTYEDTATNVIAMGNIKIELQELSIPNDGSEPVSFTDPIDVLPGTSVSKVVRVKNIGSNPAFLRIAVKKSVLLAEGLTGEVDTSLITCNINTEKWIEQDGYYYYTEKLAPGETTAPLFTEVSFAPNMSNLYQQSRALIHIQAQATQVANNGSTALDAAGWPVTE